MASEADFWVHGQDSKPVRSLRGILYLAITMLTFAWAEGFGMVRMGMTREGLYVGQSLLFSLGLFVVVAVHEFGHAAVALAVGFRFRSLNIGPLTTWRTAGQPRRYMFDWGRLFQTGGYMGAVPDTDRHVRSSAILVVLAGPVASLNAALCLWALCLGLRGTQWAAAWHSLAILGSLFVGDFVVNLIPMGYSDGTMLWHLALWTEKGRQLYSKHKSAMVSDNADLAQQSFDFAREVELREGAVDQILERGNDATPDLALAYQALGWSQFHLHRLDDAGKNLNLSVETMENCRHVEPGPRATAWQQLHLVARARFEAATAERAYTNAISAFEDWKSAARSGPGRAEVTMLLAQLHLLHRNFALAMLEISEALAQYPGGGKYQIARANLYMFRSGCEFGLGHPQAGLDDAAEAERILRSHLPASERKHAMQRLMALGDVLGTAGRYARASALLLEAADWFEQHGSSAYGAWMRIRAADYLRVARKPQQAIAAFPAAAAVAAWDRSGFLANRGEVRLDLGRVAEALADFEEAAKIAASRHSVALRQEVLAFGYLEAGRLEEAAGLARRACDTLLAGRDPNAAGALTTLALIDWRKGGEDGSASFGEALRTIEADPILEPVWKAVCLERLAARVEAAGRVAEAGEARQLARPRWRHLGLDGPQPDAAPAPAEAVARH